MALQRISWLTTFLFLGSIGGLYGCGTSTEGNGESQDEETLECEDESEWIAYPSQEKKCCPSDALTCALFDFDESDSESNYDAETGLLRFYFDGEATQIRSATVHYSITSAAGSGTPPEGVVSFRTGSIDGNVLEFDLSDISDNETIRIDNLELQDQCDGQIALLIGTTVRAAITEPQQDFDCSPPPNF